MIDFPKHGSGERNPGSLDIDKQRHTEERVDLDADSGRREAPEVGADDPLAGPIRTDPDPRRTGRFEEDDYKADTLDREGADADDAYAPLFPSSDADRFRLRWTEIQTHFVDEPRRAVEQADDLVAEVTERLTSAFTRNRDELERQWTAGDEVSTEDLRRTLRRYRSFFERLLSM